MKKIILVLMFGCLATSVFAQDDNASIKPVSGDLGVTLGINGLATTGFNFNVGHTGTLLFRYYLSDAWALRAQLSITSSSSSQSYTDSVGPDGNGSYSNSNKYGGFNVGVGIQHSFAATKRLDPYLGVEVFLGSNTSTTDSDGFVSGKIDNTFTGAGTQVGTSSTHMVTPGSTFTFGAGLVFGFNYFITNHIAVGGEFYAGFAINSIGDGTVTNTSSNAAGTTTVTSTTHGYSNTTFSPNGSGQITFSYFFPAKW
jgi:hypothetical protein